MAPDSSVAQCALTMPRGVVSRARSGPGDSRGKGDGLTEGERWRHHCLGSMDSLGTAKDSWGVVDALCLVLCLAKHEASSQEVFPSGSAALGAAREVGTALMELALPASRPLVSSLHIPLCANFHSPRPMWLSHPWLVLSHVTLP